MKPDLLELARKAGFHFYDAGYGPDVLHTTGEEYSSMCFERFAVLLEVAKLEAQPMGVPTGLSALDLALKFHETYERLAPSFGYETRQDTRAFDPDSKNGRLMVAVCAELSAAPALPVESAPPVGKVQIEIPLELSRAMEGPRGTPPYLKALEAARRVIDLTFLIAMLPTKEIALDLWESGDISETEYFATKDDIEKAHEELEGAEIAAIKYFHGESGYPLSAEALIARYGTTAPASPAVELPVVPEGCTPQDAMVLREANHVFATENQNLRKALRFYAAGEHFVTHEGSSWDSISGEPENFLEDEAGTATIEDGSIAAMALRGEEMDWGDEEPPLCPGEPETAIAAQAAKK